MFFKLKYRYNNDRFRFVLEFNWRWTIEFVSSHFEIILWKSLIFCDEFTYYLLEKSLIYFYYSFETRIRPLQDSWMSFDWTKCAICQEDKNQPLRCPLNGPKWLNSSDVYSTFLNNVSEFRSNGELPCNINLDENVTVDQLIACKAAWHKSCHLKFCTSKVNRLKEQPQKRKHDCDDPDDSFTAREMHKRSNVARQILRHCIFCNDDTGKLHSFSYLKTTDDIKHIATALGDYALLAKISGGDLIAIEAQYHISCITSFRNRYRSYISSKERGDSGKNEEKMNESRAMQELISYINTAVYDGKLIFTLSELHSLYVDRLKDFGIEKQVNKTKLKVTLLEHLDAQEQHDGKNTIFVFEEGMRNMLKDALAKRNFMDDASILAKAASIIRKDMFKNENEATFSGTFSEKCQEDSVPASLKSLVAMLINGTNLTDQDKCESQPCLTISQTILFNSKKKTSSHRSSVTTRHVREPPLPLYIGLNIHTATRSKALITTLYQLGLSVSYDRVIEVEDELATSAGERYKEDGHVVPASLRFGIFSVAGLDNLDHNPSSTTSTSSFHGTGISVFQFPTEENPGQERPKLQIPPSGKERHSLPESYSIVPLVEMNANNISTPKRNMALIGNAVSSGIVQENEWMEHALAKLNQSSVNAEDTVTWSSYHSSSDTLPTTVPAVTTLLPLFNDKAATPAMLKHGMTVVKDAITFLNPGQIPVIALDQPLFALAKQVQWKWPETHGEDVYVVMFGGLHTEMALWNTLGDLLECSGWTTALVEANVASSGTAESFLKVSHLTRTR